jgi:hypothetical protein
MFPSEEASACPVCGVELRPSEQLPPSYEARVAAALELAAVPPEHRNLPWTYPGRGRAALLVLSLVGLAVFFGPWIEFIRPNFEIVSGFHLARYRAGWFWGGAVGYFILIPLLVTRRTIFQLRGVRAIAIAFTGMTLIEVFFVFVNPPRGSEYVPVEYSWSWGLYASAVVSALAVAVAVRLGGRLDDIVLPPSATDDPLAKPLDEDSDGEIVH